MKLVALAMHQFLDCDAHLLDEIAIKLAVEVVSLILVYPLHPGLASLLPKVLLDDPHDGLLHFLLHYVVLAGRVDLI